MRQGLSLSMFAAHLPEELAGTKTTAQFHDAVGETNGEHKQYVE